tara:strand:- start:2399 stop:2734 length:336 start_codon:yes stop_codon:yes gene_type:complete
MIYNNIIDKKAFDNLAKEVSLQYPYFNSYRVNKLAYSRYLTIGGKVKGNEDIEAISNFVDKQLPIIKKEMESDDEKIKRLGYHKFLLLVLQKETYPQGNIDWVNGVFNINK